MVKQFVRRAGLGALWLVVSFAARGAPVPSVAASGPPGTANATAGGGSAPPATAYFEQGILSRSGEIVEALGPTLMGDSVNEYSGGLQFAHTDVSLPGNNALSVSVGRMLATGTRQAALATGLFGDWDLDIPRLRTITTSSGIWYGYGGANTNRCSQFSPPPLTSVVAGNKTYSVNPYQYWDGHHLYIPGSGEQSLLSRYQSPGNPATPSNTIQPSDGYAYPIVTKQHWQIRCLATMERGAGEGFLALAPDGTRYQFDHMVVRAYPGMKVGTGATLQRTEVWILPTQVTDRFGNWVHFSYGGADGWRVMSITSSDGRVITFSYSGNGNRIKSVTDATRTWNYAYDDNGGLQTVTQPDGSRWQFSLGAIERDPFSGTDPDCTDTDAETWDPLTRTGTITHPSGAMGSFSLKMTAHGRSNVPGSQATCASALASRYFTNYALASKTLSGPGMPAMTWAYSYGDPYGSYAPCNGCVNTQTVTIVDPLGNVTKNTYGTMFGINDGLLVGSTQSPPSGGTLQSTSYGYAASNAGPYATLIGYNGGYADSMSVIHTPQSQRVITQQGVTFQQTVTKFDSYARPTSLTRASSLGYSRSESTIYADQTSLWVLGQVATQTIAGVQASSVNFDANTALPTAIYKFGKLQANYSFNPDGTLASVTDPLNHANTYSNYYRGLARNIGYADGTGISATVNNIGTIASVTNEVGTTWNYTDDAMGRIASATPPGGDPVAYNPKLFSFVQVGTTEYGLDPGHWRQTITQGNAVTVNYFDARWRKRLTNTFDAADPGNTQRMQRFDYDAYNRTSFASYSQRSIASIGTTVAGTATSYDALGRPSQSVSDSELGPLTTTSQYLAGFQKQVTNPRGYATTTAFQAFDEPSESSITAISAPEGVTVSISRDIFGKPIAITRGGNANGYSVSATRSYVYDAYQLLCKTVEPEVGATIQVLDAANNVSWRAIGLGLTSTSSCDQGSVPSNKIIAYTYDARNRVTGTGFGDGSASIGRSYTPDALTSTLVTNGLTQRFSYNNRRLLTGEYMSFGWSAGRWYDANGHVSAQGYPNGTAVNFSPNALGEATQVGGYATGVSYYPNGAVARYTLGNGIVHTTTQNVRGLPAQNSDAGVLNDQYSYDANGNISAIADQQEGISSRSMSYDGLDRLTVANSPGVWGSAAYGYDALDNIRTSAVGSRNSTHNYDASNKLININTNGVYTGYVYDGQGNVTGRGTQGFYFDQGNRMQLANGGASYRYDGLGRRVMTFGLDGSTTFQMYSLEGQLLVRQPVGGGTNSSYTLQIYLGGKSIAEFNNLSDTTYIHTDGLGSPVARTNAAGALISRTRYEPYGNTAAGAVPTGVGFTGHVNDADTGLVYMQQRYYDPIAARFMSVDPITTDASTGKSFNRYEYANSNPYRYVDPDGRDGCTGSHITNSSGGCATNSVFTVQGMNSVGRMSQSSRATAVAAGAALGGSAGAVVAGGCAVGTGGLCGLGAPAIVGAGIAGGALLGNSAANLFDWISGLITSTSSNSGQATSPVINPSDVAGKTPGQIDQLATGAGLKPKGPDPQNGRGAYVDPVTGEQRILVHGDHAHVNNAAGNRLDVNGNVVPSNSPAAHLPIGTP